MTKTRTRKQGGQDATIAKRCHKTSITTPTRITRAKVGATTKECVEGKTKKRADAEGRNFRENIRSYNSTFEFASMRAQIDLPPGFGPYCFRIHV